MAGNVHGGVRVVFSAAAAAVGDDVYTEIRYGHESSHHPLLQKPVWTSESSSHSLENLRPGDHIWCHARGYKNVIQHHGIYDGTGGVYHFDTVQVGKNGDRYKVDREYIYKNCDACSSRLTQREEAGLPSTGVRFNCLRCFAHGKNVYRCEYEASIAGLVWRATGSRSTRVCKWSGEDVVRRAKWFFEHDQFGKYEVMTCNCEDFARWCKIGELGSKQVTRAEVLAGVLEVSVVGSSLTYVSLSRCRKRHEHKLKKLEIEYSLVQEIEASAVVITETMSGYSASRMCSTAALI